MRISFLLDSNNMQYLVVAKNIKSLFNVKNKDIEILECVDEIEEKSDIYILFSDDIETFLNLYNKIPQGERKNIMLLTSNIEANYILMCLKFVSNISYLKITPKLIEGSKDYEKYNIKNMKRLYKNILNFTVQVETI